MNNDETSGTNEIDNAKAKYRDALEKKKKTGGIRNNNIAGGPKVHGDQAGGSAPKIFRRKSGSP